MAPRAVKWVPLTNINYLHTSTRRCGRWELRSHIATCMLAPGGMVMAPHTLQVHYSYLHAGSSGCSRWNPFTHCGYLHAWQAGILEGCSRKRFNMLACCSIPLGINGGRPSVLIGCLTSNTVNSTMMTPRVCMTYS